MIGVDPGASECSDAGLETDSWAAFAMEAGTVKYLPKEFY